MKKMILFLMVLMIAFCLPAMACENCTQKIDTNLLAIGPCIDFAGLSAENLPGTAAEQMAIQALYELLPDANMTKVNFDNITSAGALVPVPTYMPGHEQFDYGPQNHMI